MLKKTRILFDSIAGLLIRAAFDAGLARKHRPGKPNCEKQEVIVSLTSYGRRVDSVLPYALYSLLRQRIMPDRIILQLDRDNWNEGNLPRRIKDLKDRGLVEVGFCEDLKSYKKLVPTLKEFPDAIIITTDDDNYLRPNMVGDLLEWHRRFPTKVITTRGHLPVVRNGKLERYANWRLNVGKCSPDEVVFPTGGSGCLYTKEMLFKDICREDLFLSLCPMADDVWFFFMTLLNGTGHCLVPHKREFYYPLDNFYQWTHKGSNLFDGNVHESGNDSQIRAVMEHYQIDDSLFSSE